MRGQVPPRIVLVHEGAIDGGHRLQHVLQRLAQVVAVAQAHVLVQHDVDLDVELVARVVRLQALDLLDRLGEPHREVQEHVALVRRRRRPREVADVARRRPGPVEDHVEGEEQASESVEPPELRVEADLKRYLY